MSIRLNWSNPNSSYDSVRVYRSLTKLDYANLPAPLATVPYGTLTYEDTTAAPNRVYYYALGVVKGGDQILGAQRPIGNFSNTGPGPTEVLRGDWARGYFGTVTAGDLFNATELTALYGLTVTTLAAGKTSPWMKFVYNEKILFIPQYALSLTVGWNLLYSKGLVFGTNDTGVGDHGQTPVNQRQIVTKGDNNFAVRLPRVNKTAGFDGLVADSQAEYQALFLASLGVSGPQGDWPVWEALATATYMNATTPVAEYSGANAAYVNSSGVPVVTGVATGVRTATNQAWRPVLELQL